MLARCTVAALALLTSSAAAMGQFSADAANNLRLSDASSEQVLPKISPTPDGAAYVSWFDNANGGYDVMIQKIDQCGVPQWQANGVRLADRALSSTVDYDLVTDGDGNALIAYNDDGGVAGSAQQIVIQKVDPEGNVQWGATGLTVSSGTLFKASPQIAVLSGGGIIVGWSESVTGAAQQVLLRYVDASGAAQGSAFSIAQAANYHALCDLQPGNNDSVIVLYIRGSVVSANNSTKKLWTQRFAVSAPPSPAFTPQWPTPAIIIDAPVTGLSNGYFPTFLPDGEGGAVYGWYEGGSPRNAYIQHVLESGSLKFAAPISNAVTGTGRGRIGAGLAYSPVTGEYFLASVEGSFPTQGNYSAFVQKFDPAGTRLWGDTGVNIVPQAATGQGSFITCQVDRIASPLGQGCYVTLLDLVGPTTHVLKGAHVNADQTVAFNGLISSTVEGKARPASTLTSLDNFVVAFSSGGSGVHDLYAQNLNPDGSLGTGLSIAAQPPANVNAASGTTALITARTGGKPRPTLQWRRIVAGSPVNVINGPTGSGSIISGATTGALAISNAQPSDSGLYELAATNDCGGSATSTRATLTITPGACGLADVTDIGNTGAGPDGILTVDDIIAFVNTYGDATGCPGTPGVPCNLADVTDIGNTGAGPDGILTVDDIIAFVNAFGEGC